MNQLVYVVELQSAVREELRRNFLTLLEGTVNKWDRHARCVRACVRPCICVPFQPLNSLAELYGNLYRFYVVKGRPDALLPFLAASWPCERSVRWDRPCGRLTLAYLSSLRYGVF